MNKKREPDPFSNEDVISQNTFKKLDYFETGVEFLNNNTDYAISCFQQAVNEDKKNFKLTYNIALALLSSQQYEQATHFFKSAVKLKPRMPEVYYEFGRCLAKLAGSNITYTNCYESALNCFSYAIELKKDYKEAYQGRAIVYCLLGETELSKKDFAEYDELSKPQKFPPIKAIRRNTI